MPEIQGGYESLEYIRLYKDIRENLVIAELRVFFIHW